MSMTEEQLTDALILVHEVDGHEGLKSFIRAHGLDLTSCLGLVRSQLTGAPDIPRIRKPNRERER